MGCSIPLFIAQPAAFFPEEEVGPENDCDRTLATKVSLQTSSHVGSPAMCSVLSRLFADAFAGMVGRGTCRLWVIQIR
jgi:hypothetical protein